MNAGLLAEVPPGYFDYAMQRESGGNPNARNPLYAYRYKGGPKTYPKVVGPMAQDIAKKFPGSASKVGGAMVVTG